MPPSTSVSTSVSPNVLARHLLLEIRTRYVIDKMKDDRIGGASGAPVHDGFIGGARENLIEQVLEVRLDALLQPSRCIGVVDEFYAIGSNRNSAFLAAVGSRPEPRLA